MYVCMNTYIQVKSKSSQISFIA